LREICGQHANTERVSRTIDIISNYGINDNEPSLRNIDIISNGVVIVIVNASDNETTKSKLDPRPFTVES
jgi:hypothetical protein